MDSFWILKRQIVIKKRLIDEADTDNYGNVTKS